MHLLILEVCTSRKNTTSPPISIGAAMLYWFLYGPYNYIIWIVQPVNLSDRLYFSWSLCSLFRSSHLNVSTQFCPRNAPSNYPFNDYGYYWSRNLWTKFVATHWVCKTFCCGFHISHRNNETRACFYRSAHAPYMSLSETRADSVEKRLFPEVEYRHMLVLHLKHIHGFCWGPIERESRCD